MVTTENSSWLTPNGTDKSTNGAAKLWSVSNKSSCASTQDTTNNQLKLKSTNSTTSSENKPRFGSVSKKTNSTVKSNASTKMGRPHQTMEIVRRTSALLGQGQMGSLHGLKKRKGHHLHQMPLR